MTPAAPLIGVEELRGLLASAAAPVLLDCRFELARPEAGREAWQAAHVPGARYADLDRDLSDLGKPRTLGRHPLPDAAVFAARLRDWGIASDSKVVVYDQGPGALAARAWWMLRQFRLPVRLLDGGWRAWQAAGGEARSAASEPPVVPAPSTIEGDFGTWLDNAVLVQRLGAGALLLDARESARYRGEIEPIDPVAGHVPGALNRPFADNLDAEGRFKPASELRTAFHSLLAGIDPTDVIHQCGSGVTACHNLLAMEIAGLPGSRLHAPSWSGWLADGRPVATGG